MTMDPPLVRSRAVRSGGRAALQSQIPEGMRPVAEVLHLNGGQHQSAEPLYEGIPEPPSTPLNPPADHRLARTLARTPPEAPFGSRCRQRPARGSECEDRLPNGKGLAEWEWQRQTSSTSQAAPNWARSSGAEAHIVDPLRDAPCTPPRSPQAYAGDRSTYCSGPPLDPRPPLRTGYGDPARLRLLVERRLRRLAPQPRIFPIRSA